MSGHTFEKSIFLKKSYLSDLICFVPNAREKKIFLPFKLSQGKYISPTKLQMLLYIQQEQKPVISEYRKMKSLLI